MSSEASCPKNKPVANPMDKRYSILQVFLNICGLNEGSAKDKNEV